MLLRTASVNDFSSIRRVVENVWPIAYREIISRDQIDYMLDMMYSDASLHGQILQDQCEFIVLEIENEVVGFASYNALDENRFKLHKLYVLKAHQGKGVGKMLLNEVIARSATRGAKTLELQVNKKNKAVNFYKKYNFKQERELVLDIGNGFVMDDFIMIRNIAMN